ncbi:hypothetical protein BDW69DRAFT_47208 [Aspergillus filifer]
MSATKASMGDAWEDDWESQADKLDSEPTPPPPEKKVSSKVTKAQRRAQQMEFNRQLWAEAESPQTFHFYEATSDVPLKQEFKPTVTVLSRNPQIATRQSTSGAAAGLGRLDLNADESDEEKPPEPTPEERQAMALKNREEKQRKYEEVRERLFGTPSAPTSGASSPRSETPPRTETRGKGRGRGNGRDNNNNNRDRRDQSNASGKTKQLYDPGSPSRPNSSYGRRDWQQGGDRSDQSQSPRQPIRNPRGPDSTGRGGFKPRGGKTS